MYWLEDEAAIHTKAKEQNMYSSTTTTSTFRLISSTIFNQYSREAKFCSLFVLVISSLPQSDLPKNWIHEYNVNIFHVSIINQNQLSNIKNF